MTANHPAYHVATWLPRIGGRIFCSPSSTDGLCAWYTHTHIFLFVSHEVDADLICPRQQAELADVNGQVRPGFVLEKAAPPFRCIVHVGRLQLDRLRSSLLLIPVTSTMHTKIASLVLRRWSCHGRHVRLRDPAPSYLGTFRVRHRFCNGVSNDQRDSTVVIE